MYVIRIRNAATNANRIIGSKDQLILDRSRSDRKRARFSDRSEGKRVRFSDETETYRAKTDRILGNSSVRRSIYANRIRKRAKMKNQLIPDRSSGDDEKRIRFSDEPETETLEERTSDRRKRFGPVATLERSTSVTPEVLARKWHIGKERAKQTLKVTTQRGICNVRNPLTKRLRTQRWRNKRMIPGKWYSDTMHFKVKSIMRKETVAQIFSNGFGYEEFYPCEREARCHEGLSRFVNEIGIPEHIVVDGARAQGSHETYNTSWQKLTKAHNIKQTWIRPY